MRALQPRSIVPGKPNDLYAIRTTLSWGVVGAKGHGDCADDTGETAECHRIATQEIAGEEKSTGMFILLKSCKEIMPPSSTRRMFEQDFSETRETNLAMSQEDLKFINITSGGIHKADDGHYEVPLQLRDKNVHMQRTPQSDAKKRGTFLTIGCITPRSPRNCE